MENHTLTLKCFHPGVSDDPSTLNSLARTNHMASPTTEAWEM